MKIKTIILLITTFLSTIVAASPLSLSQSPLFLLNNSSPDIMILYGNSNSMDEQSDGQAVGSASPNSKSEITRAALKSLINQYQGRVNMGLTAYAQSGISLNDLSNAPYDASYNPLFYNPSWTGARNSSTNKKFRMVNPSDTSNYIYYNVALPSYGSPMANKADNDFYCFTTDTRSNAFSNGEVIVNNNITDPSSGPWLSYDCYLTKTGNIDAGPPPPATNPAPTQNPTVAGYSNYLFSPQFVPTDSDLAQGITNYGNQISQYYVSPAWFSNTSPGYGYVHIPIAPLNSSQVSALNTKLGTSQFTVSGTETNPSYPLVNAGLSPIAGTVNTIASYFAGTLTNTSQGGSLPAPPNSCGKNFLIMLTDGLPSVLSNGSISYNSTTLLNDLTTSVANIKTNQNVYTYVVGFALPYGVSPTQLQSIATAGGTNTPYYADNPTALTSTLNNVLNDVISKTSSMSAVSLNSGYISNGEVLYQARFNTIDWSGDLLAVPLSSTGALPPNMLTAALWRAGQKITSQSATSRTILTTKASTLVGIPFRWPANITSPSATELDITQTALLNTNPTTNINDGNGSLRLNYLRGDQSQENILFRPRSSTLGDIIDSAPTFVGTPSSPFFTTDYLAFRTKYSNRTPVIYVGSNDGMLHGFNALTGNEVLGYVPNEVFSNLNQLPSTAYSHLYFVDGSPNSSDVTFADASWHTVLATTMGVGGKGIFVLDVTDPSQFTEANAASIVKFEFTDANNSDIGYIQGQPQIVKLNTGKWAAVFGNGYNNTGTGNAALFIVDIETGALIQEISTKTGSSTTPNGLSTPTLIDVDGNGTADFAYAGDLYGNVWKFDLTSTNPSNWKLAINGGKPLFAAQTGQQITEQPEVTASPYGGYMVIFGTGQYLQTTDISNTTTQTLYGIWDNNNTVTVPLKNLQQQTATQVTPTYRSVTDILVNYPTQQGWYVNMPLSGERSVTSPLLTGGVVYFTTLVPNTAVCTYGGTSWLMAIDFLNGGQLSYPIMDTNGDGVVNSKDTPYGGVNLFSISSSPTLLQGLGNQNTPLQELFFNLSSGNVTGLYTAGSQNTSRRTSWKTILQQ